MVMLSPEADAAISFSGPGQWRPAPTLMPRPSADGQAQLILQAAYSAGVPGDKGSWSGSLLAEALYRVRCKQPDEAPGLDSSI